MLIVAPSFCLRSVSLDPFPSAKALAATDRIAFTRIFFGPSSLARTRVIELTAPLVPLYTAAMGGVYSPAPEPMLMMLPPSGGNMATAAWVASSRPFTLFVEHVGAMLWAGVIALGAARSGTRLRC